MSAESKPTVLIVGAGLGGVMLGALLEKADIPYLIVERAITVKPLGNVTATPIFYVPLMHTPLFCLCCILHNKATHPSFSYAGSALAVGPSMVPVFEQMGIDKEYIALGKQARYSMFIKENQEKLLALDYSPMDELYALPLPFFSVPCFYLQQQQFFVFACSMLSHKLYSMCTFPP